MDQISLAANSINENDVLWVVTVPAIWKESAKNLMRKAAEAAELVTPDRSASLMLALEPEAASMWCLRTKQVELNKGDQYISTDGGGGTVYNY